MNNFAQSELFSNEEILECTQSNSAGQDRAKEHAELLHYENPRNDNERLMNFQYEWLVNKNENARAQMFNLAFVVTRRILWREKKRRRLYLGKDAEDELVSAAFFYVFRRLEKGNVCIAKKNWIVTLSHGVQHALGYRTAKDFDLSFEGLFEKVDFSNSIYRYF